MTLPRPLPPRPLRRVLQRDPLRGEFVANLVRPRKVFFLPCLEALLDQALDLRIERTSLLLQDGQHGVPFAEDSRDRFGFGAVEFAGVDTLIPLRSELVQAG